MLFQSHSTAILIALDIFKNVKSFLKKPSIIWKKTQVFKGLENLTNSIAFSGKFATFSHF